MNKVILPFCVVYLLVSGGPIWAVGLKCKDVVSVTKKRSVKPLTMGQAVEKIEKEFYEKMGYIHRKLDLEIKRLAAIVIETKVSPSQVIEIYKTFNKKAHFNYPRPRSLYSNARPFYEGDIVSLTRVSLIFNKSPSDVMELFLKIDEGVKGLRPTQWIQHRDNVVLTHSVLESGLSYKEVLNKFLEVSSFAQAHAANSIMGHAIKLEEYDIANITYLSTREPNSPMEQVVDKYIREYLQQ